MIQVADEARSKRTPGTISVPPNLASQKDQRVSVFSSLDTDTYGILFHLTDNLASSLLNLIMGHSIPIVGVCLPALTYTIKITNLHCPFRFILLPLCFL